MDLDLWNNSAHFLASRPLIPAQSPRKPPGRDSASFAPCRTRSVSRRCRSAPAGPPA